VVGAGHGQVGAPRPTPSWRFILVKCSQSSSSSPSSAKPVLSGAHVKLGVKVFVHGQQLNAQPGRRLVRPPLLKAKVILVLSHSGAATLIAILTLSAYPVLSVASSLRCGLARSESSWMVETGPPSSPTDGASRQKRFLMTPSSAWYAAVPIFIA